MTDVEGISPADWSRIEACDRLLRDDDVYLTTWEVDFLDDLRKNPRPLNDSQREEISEIRARHPAV